MEINRQKKYFVGNWKMNKTFSELETFIKNVPLSDCHQWIAPQMIHLHALREMTKTRSPIKVGSQNHCHVEVGAFTGETSFLELKELGIDFTIVGHSERRQYYNETNQTVAQKVKLSLKNNIPSILCVGETLEERENGNTLQIIETQLREGLTEINSSEYKQLLIAYEPVWAIGTGKTASPDQAQEVHDFIRKTLENIFGPMAQTTPILYGGSVKPDNVSELMGKNDIDGALIGGASISPESYNQLCQKGL